MHQRLGFVLFLAIASSHAIAQETGPIRVVASELPPCVFATESPSGFSIDLWHALADELDLEYDMAMVSFEEKLDAIRTRSADVAIGCISIAANREGEMDFSHTVVANGFRAVSLEEQSIIPSFSDESLKMLLLLLAFVLFFAHLMWISERGQPEISAKYFPGVFQAVWFSLVTMSTVGYGDIAPHRWVGRISAVLLIVTGVTAFGVIFGQFAADAIGTRAENQVESVSDLRHYTTGTKVGTASADYLNSLGVELKTFEGLDDATDALRRGEVDIVMHDTLAVTYLVQRSDDLHITGPLFAPHYLGIALTESSELREPLNTALLKLQQDGRFQAIQEKWF